MQIRKQNRMMGNGQLPVCALALSLAAVLFVGGDHASAGKRSSSPEAQFKIVRAEVKRFRLDEKKKKYRHNYEQLITKMRAIAGKYPRSNKADDALLVAAQLYEELYEVSRVGADLSQACLAYEEVANRYPKSTLADDALFRAAKLRLERQGDQQGARGLLERVVKMRGYVDHRPLAKELLERLPEPRRASKASRKVAAEQANVAEIMRQVNATAPKGSVEVRSVPAKQKKVTYPKGPGKGASKRRITLFKEGKQAGETFVKIRFNRDVGIVEGEIPHTADLPHRLFFDVTPVRLSKKTKRQLETNNPLIRRVRLGQYDSETVRIVVELKGNDKPIVQIGNRPYELVLVTSKRKQETLVAHEEHHHHGHEIKSLKKKNHGAASASVLNQIGLPVRTIVVDAGHGGHDSGAVGKNGIREKDVNLIIANKVAAQLKKSFPKMRIIMTRTTDTFIELARRTEIANEAGADLFISIHANANPSKHIRGVETYYLNISHDRYASRLAARENSGPGGKAISDLDFILADLSMKSNVDDSIRLGRHVQTSLVSTLRQDWDKVNDLGLKHALFYVLLGTRMPSILVETSFLSNPEEEKRLASLEYQNAVASGIVRGVRVYMEERQAFNSK